MITNVNKYRTSYIYMIVYAISLIAIFMESTQINGLTMYTADPVSNIFIDNVCKIVVIMAILMNILLFAVYKLIVNKQIDKYVYLFVLIFLIKFIGIIFHSPVMPQNYLLYYLLILNAFLVNPNTFIKTDFILKIIIIFSIISAYFMHLFPSNNDVILIRHGIARYSLGFNYSNVLASAILGLIFAFILSYGKKLNIYYLLLIIFIISFIFFHLTNSRSMFVSIVFLFSSLFLSQFKVIRKFFTKNILYIILFTLLLSLLLVITYNNQSLPFSNSINKLSSDRLVDLSYAIDRYPIKLLGQILPQQTSMYDISKAVLLDNGFIGSLISFGILGTSVYLYFFIKAGLIAKRYKDILLCLVIIAMAIQFMFEFDYDKVWMISPLIYSFSLENKDKFIHIKDELKGA